MPLILSVARLFWTSRYVHVGRGHQLLPYVHFDHCCIDTRCCEMSSHQSQQSHCTRAATSGSKTGTHTGVQKYTITAQADTKSFTHTEGQAASLPSTPTVWYCKTSSSAGQRQLYDSHSAPGYASGPLLRRISVATAETQSAHE